MHQLLTKPEHQKTLLDGYTGEYALTQRMAEHYRQWHQSCRELAQHQQQSQERAARADLLQYQLKELNEFNPLPGEFEQIDEEYKRLANSGQLLSTCQHALTVLADGEEANLQSQLYTAKQLVSELVGMDSKLSACWICWKRRPFSSARPATSCATITTVWISIRTVCSNLSSGFPGKSRWRVNTR
jgi:DNA repair protein RecN (Recombination protein N)